MQILLEWFQANSAIAYSKIAHSFCQTNKGSLAVDQKHLDRELRCTSCSYHAVCSPGDMVRWLTNVGMLRRTSEPELALLAELFVSAGAKFVCPDCGARGLIVTELSDIAEDDEEAWGMARACEGCRKPIALERLEIFPDTRLCPICQAKDEAGELSNDDVEYCPKCGSLMEIRQSRATGITRFVMKCANASCRSR